MKDWRKEFAPVCGEFSVASVFSVFSVLKELRKNFNTENTEKTEDIEKPSLRKSRDLI
jgi:hypothetical protein